METGKWSLEMASAGIEYILDQFERELISKAVAVKVKPYGVMQTQVYILQIIETSNMASDPRADDAFIEKVMEEPAPC